MLKKFFPFSLLLIGLMIAPTTAFAEQSKTNVQEPADGAAQSIIQRTTQTNICGHFCI